MVYPLNYKEINKALKCFNQTKLCGDDYPQQGFEPKGTTFFCAISLSHTYFNRI